MLEEFARPLSFERHKERLHSCGERSKRACFGDCMSKQATCIIILDYGTKVIDHSHVARCYPILCRNLAFPLPSLKTAYLPSCSKKIFYLLTSNQPWATATDRPSNRYVLYSRASEPLGCQSCTNERPFAMEDIRQSMDGCHGLPSR